jgi:hypothetical protein
VQLWVLLQRRVPDSSGDRARTPPHLRPGVPRGATWAVSPGLDKNNYDRAFCTEAFNAFRDCRTALVRARERAGGGGTVQAASVFASPQRGSLGAAALLPAARARHCSRLSLLAPVTARAGHCSRLSLLAPAPASPATTPSQADADAEDRERAQERDPVIAFLKSVFRSKGGSGDSGGDGSGSSGGAAAARTAAGPGAQAVSGAAAEEEEEEKPWRRKRREQEERRQREAAEAAAAAAAAAAATAEEERRRQRGWWAWALGRRGGGGGGGGA